MGYSNRKMRDPYNWGSSKNLSVAIRGASELKEAVTVAVVSGENILFGQRRDSLLWTLPGGGKRGDESPYQAAVRELFEETGLRAVQLRNIGMSINDQGTMVHCFVYEINTDQPGALDITAAKDPDMEVLQWEWVDCTSARFKEIKSKLHHPNNYALKKLGLL